MMMQPGYLDSLNPKQREAVETTEGPVLVLAGAGTGKTRALTARLAHILHSGRAFPGQIMAVTFTNKAAQEMKQRVSDYMDGQPVEGWWLGTFHALAARMLRRHADLAGLSSNFTILDADDTVRLIKQLMEAENIDTKKWPPKAVAAKIERWKDQARFPADIPNRGDNAGNTGNTGKSDDIAGGRAPYLYRLYQDRLKSLNACDFGDLLMHVIAILRNPANAGILEDYHRKFKYILVDEYQDTNVAQYMWLRLLARGSNNLCCVGDDDQSIYGWRGAEVGNILRFEKDFPGAKIIRLEQNYRSTSHILGAANALIANNQSRLGKDLFTQGADEGHKIQVRGLWDGEAESRWIGEEIESLQAGGMSLDQIAILVRAGFQMREFEERFIQLGLPYKVLGGPRFYERAEIRDALAYLRVVAQSADDLALERIINTPKRGIGAVTIKTLYAHARGRGVSLYAAIGDLVNSGELSAKARGALGRLCDDFERWRSRVDTTHHATLTNEILEESGYFAMWQGDKNPDAPGRLENLKELISGMDNFENLAQFLEHVSLVMENQDRTEGAHVTLMTLHGAKGLEYDCVFLPGWEDGLFPSQRSMNENSIKGLEEERRLAYVGLTRARQRLYVSYAARRRMYGSWVDSIPSRFVEELPAAHIEVETERGMYGAGRSDHWDSSGFAPQPHLRHTAQIIDAVQMHDTGQTYDEAAQDTVRPGDAGGGICRGARVHHVKFGCGTIINIDGHKLDIAFDQSGHKRVMDSFVEPLNAVE